MNTIMKVALTANELARFRASDSARATNQETNADLRLSQSVKSASAGMRGTARFSN